MQRELRTYLRWPVFSVVFSISTAVLICVSNWGTGLLVSLLALISGSIYLRFYMVSGTEISQAMTDFSAATDSIQAWLADWLDICYDLLNRTGAFSYRNVALTRLLAAERKTSQRLEDLFPELTREELTKTTESADYHLSLDTLRLRVWFVREQIDTESVFVIYFYGETALLTFWEEERSRRPMVGLLYLDNHKEAMESIDKVRRPLLTAMVGRKIARYSDGMQAVVKKSGKDKYFFVIERHYLQELLDNQFDILEQVKTVNIDNKMCIALPISIGDDGNSYAQCCDSVRQAIGMALGCSGDQAMVKDGENICYSGSKSDSKKKATRVKVYVKAHASRESIENEDRLLVMGHKLMDIDLFGVAVDIRRITTTIGKEVHIVFSAINDAIRPMLERFCNGDYPEDMFVPEGRTLQLLDEDSILVIVDTNRSFMAEDPRLLDIVKTIVVLNHHRQSQDPIRNVQLSYIETCAPSACEMVVEVVQYISDDVKTRAVETDVMHVDIVIDIYNFRNQAGVRAFKAVASLRRSGADVTRVQKLFCKELDDYRAKSEAIHNAEVYRENSALSYCNAMRPDSLTVVGVQAANDLSDMISVKTSIVTTTFREKMYLSARAIDGVNVRVIMEKLGGDGHRTIVGAQLPGPMQEEAMERAKQVIDEVPLKGEIS